MTILHIEHKVRNYDRWKASFDDDPLDRKGAGVRHYRIARAVDNPAYVMVDLELETTAQAKHMLASLQDMWPRRMGVLIDDPKGRVFEVAEAQEL